MKLNEKTQKLQESINGKVSETRGDIEDAKMGVELHE